MLCWLLIIISPINNNQNKSNNKYNKIIFHPYLHPYKKYQNYKYKNIKFKVSFLYSFLAHIATSNILSTCFYFSLDLHFHFHRDLESHKNLLIMGNCNYNCRLIYLCLLLSVFMLRLLLSISIGYRKFSCLFGRILGGCIVTIFRINGMLVIFLFMFSLFSTLFIHSSYSLIFHDPYQHPPSPLP